MNGVIMKWDIEVQFRIEGYLHNEMKKENIKVLRPETSNPDALEPTQMIDMEVFLYIMYHTGIAPHAITL